MLFVRRSTRHSDKHEARCYRCGGKGHNAKEKSCPARGEKCAKCHKLDHFAAVCRSMGKKDKLHCVDDDDDVHTCDDDDSDDEFSFAVGEKKLEMIDIVVRGVKICAGIDSGANSNVLDKETWVELKRQSYLQITQS